MSYNRGKKFKKNKQEKNPIIISDFTLGWYSNNKNENYLINLINHLNQGNMFSVILPNEYTKYIRVPFKVQISNKEILSKNDGSEVYQIYKDTDSIVVSNF